VISKRIASEATPPHGPGGAVARLLRRLRRGERGQSLVELSFMLPLLLAIVFAVIEFGFVLSDQIALVHAAEDAARAGTAPGCLANAACAQSAAQTQAALAITDIKRCSAPTTTVPAPSGTPQQLSVTISCTYNPVTPLGALLVGFFGNALNTHFTLTYTSTMRVAQ